MERQDPILKERLFGLTGREGNHGEDVKEYYFYVDNLPTHAYQRWLYKYPQAAYPYADLVATNTRRSRHEMEYELLDTGVFAADRYFDVEVTYAKAGVDDLVCRIAITNRGPDAAPIHLLPTLWFRNTWTFHPHTARPSLRRVDGASPVVRADHHEIGTWHLPQPRSSIVYVTTSRTPPGCGRSATRRRSRRTASPIMCSTAHPR